MNSLKTPLACLCALAIAAASFLAFRGSSNYIVVYTALDRSFSEPIFKLFEERTGIAVKAVYDSESTKTVGLVNRIRSERDRPRCDVFWNNEIVNTLRLQSEGLLAPCSPKAAESFPEPYRDAEGHWHGFAARARVLIVNTDLVADESFPGSVRDLADPRYKGRTAIAKPLFGTTASHVACLWAKLGEKDTRRLLESFKANDIQIHGGNKGCAVAVSAGQAAFALTDTDDAMIELEASKPVRIVYPDDAPNGMGTLFLPNTLALVKGGPHPEKALQLIEFLLSAEVEKLLADGPSAQIPLCREAEPNPRVRGPGEVKSFEVDFSSAATAFEAARKIVEEQFLR